MEQPKKKTSMSVREMGRLLGLGKNRVLLSGEEKLLQSNYRRNHDASHDSEF